MNKLNRILFFSFYKLCSKNLLKNYVEPWRRYVGLSYDSWSHGENEMILRKSEVVHMSQVVCVYLIIDDASVPINWVRYTVHLIS